MKVNLRMATSGQVKYIDDLFNHLGFEPQDKRGFLKDGYNKTYPDELTSVQASALIEYLSQRWEQEKANSRNGRMSL